MGIFNRIHKNNSEFFLENVVKKNKEYPRTFLIPIEEEKNKLEMGQLVKLIFVFNKTLDNGCRAEKMWVEVTQKQNDIYHGILTNDPRYIKTIKKGDEITFTSDHIAGIYGGTPAFNEKLLAIITKKALDNRQINWLVRTDDLHNEKDSGWQLFYGDENDDYLNDSSNAILISLEQVLSFEPLLEDVFRSNGYQYEYSKKENKFIEVK